MAARVAEPTRWVRATGTAATDPIEQILRDLDTTLGCRVTVHDVGSVLRDARGHGLLRPERGLHAGPHCPPESDHPARRRCFRHHDDANELARTHRDPFVLPCWRGGLEVVVPVYLERTHALTFFAGSFDSRTPEEVLDRTGRILQVAGRGLVARFAGATAFSEDYINRRRLVRKYILTHAHNDIALADIARLLHRSESRAGHLVRELFDCTFVELLQQERIRRARSLLTGTALSIEQVATECGYASGEYFCRVFKSAEGIPPSTYRRRQGSTGPSAGHLRARREAP